MITMLHTTITPSDLPASADFDVRTSSFFKHHDQLPTPAEVRSQARAQWQAGKHWGWKSRRVTEGYNAHPVPAVFEFKNIAVFVKWGSAVGMSEGQALYAIRNSCGESVPVPELYGWRTDGDQMFLYMEAIHGRTLEDAWPALKDDERLRIATELRTIMDSLRQLKQDPSDKFVGKSLGIILDWLSNTIDCEGNIARGCYYERALFEDSQSELGPFTSVKDFHDCFIQQYKRMMLDPETVPEPCRKELPDDSNVVFTHGDFHRSNVIISSTSPHVIAIIDWEQSAWLPAYWEDCKAHWTAESGGEWASKYLTLILDQHESVREAWWYYTNPVGC